MIDRSLPTFARLFVLLALALVALAARADLPTGIVKGPSVEGITEYRLANGLTVLLFPDATKPTTLVNVTYKVGSRMESYGETGMAHLLEHLMFKGTTHMENVFQELGRRGMRFNGTTSFDRTNYFETFPTSDANLEWALAMEADRMVNANIARKDLDSEMTVVRNEMEMGENAPRQVLLKRMMSVAYDWHNYSNLPIGARSDVENVDIGRLQAFYRLYYQPDNAVLTVAGAFDPDKVLASIAKDFSPIPKPSRTLPPLYTKEPVQDGERSVVLRRNGDTQFVGALYKTVPGGHPDGVAAEALGEILSVEPAGRLYKALVEAKKASAIEGGAWSLHDPGVLIFFAQVPANESIEPARAAMIETLEGFGQHPVTDAEVERVRAKALKAHDDAINNPQRLGIELSESIALGDWRLFFLRRDDWRKVTAKDVQRVAEAYLRPANRTLAQFFPTASPQRAPDPPEVDVLARVKDYKGDAALAAGEAFDPTPANLESRTQRLALANGMKLALLPKKTRGGTVNIQMWLHQGDESSLKGKAIVGSVMADMLSRGTAKRDRQAYEDELDKLRAKLRIDGDATEIDATGETVRENLPALLSLLAEAVRTPAFSEKEFDTLKREQRDQLEQERSDPQHIAVRAVARHVNPYPPDDVRYEPTLDEEIARLEATTLAQVKDFHARFVGASHAEIAVVGDFDAAEMRALIERLFGDWKSPAPYARVPKPYRPTTAASMSFETPDKANAMAYGRLQIPLTDLADDFAPLLVANHALGAAPESRLPDRVREKEGLSYSVGSGLRPSYIDPNSTFVVYAIFAPENLGKVKGALGEELTRATKTGLTQKEIDDAKRALMQQRRIARAQDGTIASALVTQAYLGRTFAESAKLDAAIESTTLAQANAVLAKYLATDRVAFAYAGDFARVAKAAAVK
jgi:zinc protease